MPFLAKEEVKRRPRRDVGGMRGLGQLIALGGALLSAVAVVAFLAKRPPQTPPGPSYAVAKVADVSSTPRPVSVVMRRGADRLQQREGTGPCPCNLANMGFVPERPSSEPRPFLWCAMRVVGCTPSFWRGSAEQLRARVEDAPTYPRRRCSVPASSLSPVPASRRRQRVRTDSCLPRRQLRPRGWEIMWTG